MAEKNQAVSQCQAQNTDKHGISIGKCYIYIYIYIYIKKLNTII